MIDQRSLPGAEETLLITVSGMKLMRYRTRGLPGIVACTAASRIFIFQTRQRIPVQHREISEFSDVDTADEMIHMQRVSWTQSDGMQRLLRRDALVRSQNAVLSW